MVLDIESITLSDTVSKDIRIFLKMSTKKDSHKIGRDASTGQFIPVKEAQRRPTTTVVETIKNASPKPAQRKK